VVSDLTWNTFRNQLILEYEIPKWDGDLGRPNFYVPATPAIARRKASGLLSVFGTQRSKDWFSEETFLGLNSSDWWRNRRNCDGSRARRARASSHRVGSRRRAGAASDRTQQRRHPFRSLLQTRIA
jgi:hypothetical protein